MPHKKESFEEFKARIELKEHEERSGIRSNLASLTVHDPEAQKSWITWRKHWSEYSCPSNAKCPRTSQKYARTVAQSGYLAF